MSEVVSTLERIDTEYPAIKLCDGSVWRMESVVLQMELEFFGDAI